MAAGQAAKFLEIYNCSAADEFMDRLSPRGPHFRALSPDNGWVFRGIGCSSHELLPKALRPDKDLARLHELARTSEYLREHREYNFSQLIAEVRLVKTFFRVADQRGLPLPEDSQELRAVLDTTLRYAEKWEFGEPSAATRTHDVPEQWPPRTLVSLVALAQHHGLPTRLLDWTRSSYVAAYFAAKSALELPLSQSDRLSVWALDLEGLARYAQRAREKDDLARIRIHIATAPRAGNPNLHAQHGLFTFQRYTWGFENRAVDRRPLDAQLIVENPPDIDDALLLTFTLPKDEAKDVLLLLAQERIGAASLFPGFDGVVKEIGERSLWSAQFYNEP